uniref:CoA-transferase n=1 Tax=Psychrobacter sp. I-STPA6b TaxID=2585718 RepID=UPI0029CAB59E
MYENEKKELDDVIDDGKKIEIGGFGMCGIKEDLIGDLRESGVKEIKCISNNEGVDGFGLGIM